MQISVANVIIHMNAMTQVAKQVWLWEIPILEARFGEGGFTRTEDTEIEIAELPEASMEMAKLSRAHGFDSKSQVSYAELAYGKGSKGIKALASEIDAAAGVKPKRKRKAKAKAKKVEAKKPPAKPAVEKDDTPGDPLDMG